MQDGTVEQNPATIRDRRLSQGLSQTALAASAGCSRATVANIEGGYVPRKSDAIRRIERALSGHPVGSRRSELVPAVDVDELVERVARRVVELLRETGFDGESR